MRPGLFIWKGLDPELQQRRQQQQQQQHLLFYKHDNFTA